MWGPILLPTLIALCFLTWQNQLSFDVADSHVAKLKLVSFLTSVDSVIPPPFADGSDEEIELFDRFIKTYNKTYVRGTRTYQIRLKRFRESLKRRTESTTGIGSDISNSTPEHPRFNQFSDLSPNEFRKTFLRLRIPPKMMLKSPTKNLHLSAKSLRKRLRKMGLPLRWDWRHSDAVTPVKNQGVCGACYAVSPVEVIETMESLRVKRVIEPLSVQQVIDCSTGHRGCHGGNPRAVLRWLNGSNSRFLQHHRPKPALMAESQYPNRFVNQRCHRRFIKPIGIRIKDYSCMELFDDELAILARVYRHGPVTAAVDASNWQDYLGGIIQHRCSYNINHAVVVVGYDATGQVPFYVIRNSWGSRFGHRGYVHVRVGRHLCGITTQVCGVSV